MLGVDSHMWSMSKSKANFFRIMALLSGLITASECWNHICGWKNPLTTLLFHVLFLFFIFYPRLILPCIVLAPLVIHLCYYKQAYKHPPHIDVRLSHAEDAHPDEEFDTFPTTWSFDIVRMRYDCMRSICGRRLLATLRRRHYVLRDEASIPPAPQELVFLDSQLLQKVTI